VRYKTSSNPSFLFFIIFLFLVVLAGPAHAGFDDLGAASQYSLLGLGKPADDADTGTGKIDLGSCTIYGDVGLGPYGTLDFQGPASIVGDLYIDPTYKSILDLSGTVTGSTVMDQSLVTAVDDAIAASIDYAAMTPTHTPLGAVDTSTVITGIGGLNIIEISAVDLEVGETLRVEGGPDDVFVLNVLNGFDLKGDAAIFGSPTGQLLVNVVGGGSKISTDPGTLIDGVLLGVDRVFQLQGISGPAIGAELAEMKVLGGGVIRPLSLFREPRDLGGDGNMDVLMRNVDTGRLRMWEMSGPLYTILDVGPLNPIWDIVAIADFDRDLKADLLMRNGDTGRLQRWKMNANAYTVEDIGPLSLLWDVAGTGDFDGDGKHDILLRHTGSGDLAIWHMDGNTFVEISSGWLRAEWDIVGIGDMSGDGKADLVLRHSELGRLRLLERDGDGFVQKDLGGFSTNWAAEGIGDFDGDGRVDILVRHKTLGRIRELTWDGVVLTELDVGGLRLEWQVVLIGDITGDGMADLVLQHDTRGRIRMWEMDGAAYTQHDVGPLATIWEIQPPTLEPASVPVTATDDATAVISDSPVTIDVLSNDSPSTGLSIVPGSLSLPANGEVALNPDQTITYRQAGLAFESAGLNLYKNNCQACHSVDDFSGIDSFSYTATDGVSTSTATVTITVTSFDTLASSYDLSGYSHLATCADLPSIKKHSDCLGLTDSEVAAIGRFLGRVF